jgi:hypothetical protein
VLAAQDGGDLAELLGRQRIKRVRRARGHAVTNASARMPPPNLQRDRKSRLESSPFRGGEDVKPS